MNAHFKILGYLYLVMGIISLGASVLFAYALYTDAPGSLDPQIQQILIDAGYGNILLGLLFIVSTGTLVTGFFILIKHRFARSLARFFAIIGLIDFPLGTLLGIYTLWVLSQSKADDEGLKGLEKKLANVASESPINKLFDYKN